jgi:cobalt-zinc-cadmium efflux system outer membrane protein
VSNSFAQNSENRTDTIRITIEDAEKEFLSKNLLLLAQKFNIQEARAYELQAKLWNNPNLFVEQSIYNNLSNKYFQTQTGEAGKPQTQGENIVQLQQLLLLAGKRNKQINLAKINSEISEYTFFDLLRSLKFDLRTTFYQNYYLEQTLAVYEKEIESLEKTVELYQRQYEKGNIPFKEVIRLKAFLFNLETERKNFKTSLNENQQDFLLLLSNTTSSYVIPLLRQSEIDSIEIADIKLADLILKAQDNRYDLKLRDAESRYERMNLSYQRALAVPDLKVGGTYDRNGSYVQNYYGVNVNVDLPVFNRNQGNIEAAKARVKSSDLLLNSYSQQVEKEVEKVYFRALENDNLYKAFDIKFPQEFNRLIEGITSNYEKRNISVMEFIDFYESYKNNIIQFNQLQIDRITSIEELNFTTGTNIINY